MGMALSPSNLNLPATIHPVRFCGMAYWTCRHCDALNRDRVRYGTWKVRCSNRECNRMMMFRAIQQDVPLGWHARRP
jgi:hypothetical protein